ncbi:MAG: type II secretion system F family protein [Halanaerobiales bacterium]
MIINVVFSLILLLILVFQILGIVLVNPKDIELVKSLQILALKTKNNTFTKDKIIKISKKNVLLNIYTKVKFSRLVILIDSSYYKLLTIKVFSFIHVFKKNLIRLFYIKYKSKNKSEIFYLKFLIEAIKKLFLGNFVGSAIAIFYLRAGKQNLSLIVYLIIISIALISIYIPVDNLIQLKKRRMLIIKKELPKIVLKLNLLCNAGLTLSQSFKHIIKEDNEFLQKELANIYSQVMEGKTYIEAGKEFIKLYELKELIYFFRIITQAQIQGSDNFLQQLESLRIELQFNRLNKAKKKSEVADAKLLLPLTMVFVGIMLIVIVPVFMSIM